MNVEREVGPLTRALLLGALGAALLGDETSFWVLFGLGMLFELIIFIFSGLTDDGSR